MWTRLVKKFKMSLTPYSSMALLQDSRPHRPREVRYHTGEEQQGREPRREGALPLPCLTSRPAPDRCPPPLLPVRQGDEVGEEATGSHTADGEPRRRVVRVSVCETWSEKN
jgi:hypothetical protein